MARSWRSHHTYVPVDPKTYADVMDESYGWGGSEEFRYDGEWLSDEILRKRADREADYIFRQLVSIRDHEIKLDRAKAEPFWKKWLG